MAPLGVLFHVLSALWFKFKQSKFLPEPSHYLKDALQSQSVDKIVQQLVQHNLVNPVLSKRD